MARSPITSLRPNAASASSKGTNPFAARLVHHPLIPFGNASMSFARARLLIADVVVDDDGGEGDAAEVGQGVFDAPMDVKQLIEPWVQLWCW